MFPRTEVLLKGLEETMIVKGLDGSVKGTLSWKYEGLVDMMGSDQRGNGVISAYYG